MKTLIFISLLFLVCCGPSKNERSQPTDNWIDDLLNQRGLYLMEMSKVQGEAGFIELDGCDSALFSGLAMASGLDVDIFAAESYPGRWFRTPDKRCYDEGRSGSDISRDMLAGILFGLWSRDDNESILQIHDYGQNNGWVMGRGPIDRTYFTPNFVNTVKSILGKDRLPEVWVDPQLDHQRHVSALNIILRGEAIGNIPKEAFGILQHFATKSPENALFQYGLARFGDGDQQKTLDILRNEAWFPADRLPTSADRCGRWLWERDVSEQYTAPCDDGKTHSGADFTFIVWLLEQSRR